LTVEQSGKRINICKGDVSRLYYIRFKPMTDSAKYAAQEMALPDPELWWYMLNLEGKIPVRLYDSSMPEDNEPVKCKTNNF
ncbi:MAG TPA: hypothetical protein VKU60_11600, partial [Chloroflexota bacterium]|nr:hypothetical protein [Chloroflexota bacterium]